MTSFSAARLADIEPYIPGEQNNGRSYIRLNTNEAPFEPPQAVVEAVAKAAKTTNFYSDPALKKLKEAIADHHRVPENMVLATNGSDEALGFVFMAYTDEKHPIAIPDVTYGFYKNLASVLGTPVHEIPLNEDFTLNPEDYCGINKTVVIANPAAHTGLTINEKAINEICKTNPNNAVVIDEAYAEFSEVTAIPQIRIHDNLMVVRTFSKSRFLAGARLGYVLANADIIADLERVRAAWNPYNVSSMGIAAGVAAYAHNDWYEGRIRAIAQNREWFKSELRELGFFVTDSKGNFVLCESKKMSGLKIYEALKERGFLVRCLSQKRIANMVRISIGDPADMINLLNILQELVG